MSTLDLMYCADCRFQYRGVHVCQGPARTADAINHPPHYGGADNPYEAIKVIEAWGLGFNLGNAAKYISRAEHKGAAIQDLEKSIWYIRREIEKRKKFSAVV